MISQKDNPRALLLVLTLVLVFSMCVSCGQTIDPLPIDPTPTHEVAEPATPSSTPTSTPTPTSEAVDTTAESPDPTIEPQLADAVVGDIIEFGGYDWLVLDVQDGRLLILTERIIEDRPYHNEFANVTWESCDLRVYLNNEFYNSFSESDKLQIAETHVINNNNPWYGTSGGKDTQDYIFLLSLEELVEYFGDSGELTNRPKDSDRDWTGDGYADYIHDQYNEARIAYYIDDNNENNIQYGSWWWLRSVGYRGYAVYVYYDGIVMRGNMVHHELGGVRPAMWIEVD